jgi:hypothetical protein
VNSADLKCGASVAWAECSSTSRSILSRRRSCVFGEEAQSDISRIRQSAEGAPTLEESDIVLRNHVTFTAKTPELRAWTGVMVLQSLEKFLLHRHYAEIFRIASAVGDSI